MNYENDSIERKDFYSEKEFSEYGLSIINSMFDSDRFKSKINDNSVFIIEGFENEIGIIFNKNNSVIIFELKFSLHDNLNKHEFSIYLSRINEFVGASFYVEGSSFKNTLRAKNHISFMKGIGVGQIYANALTFSNAVLAAYNEDEYNNFITCKIKNNVIPFTGFSY